MSKFEIFRDRAGEYRWRLIAGNGQIVAASEGYTTKYSARRSADNVKALASIAIIVEHVNCIGHR
ncbi:MAG: YegP family protein [Patescibacteria group bacterium]